MRIFTKLKLCADITYRIVRTTTGPSNSPQHIHRSLEHTCKKTRYNKLCGSLRSLAHRISLLPSHDPFRARLEGQILSKLYDMGVLNSQAKLSDVDNKLTVASFCRRRLAVIMVTSKMAETVSAVSTQSSFPAIKFHSYLRSGSQIYRAGPRPRRTRKHY